MNDGIDRERDRLQAEFDAAPAGTTLVLDQPRERPGPVVIRRSVAVAGKGVTIWAFQGPVVTIDAADVTLRDLIIEATGADDLPPGENPLALYIRGANTRLENIEVRGNVLGLPGEEGAWHYPHLLQLGPLAHGMEFVRRFRVIVPVACTLSSNIAGVDIEPQALAAGTHEVRLHIERLSRDTLVSGTIFLHTTGVRRRLTVNALVRAAEEGLPEPSRESDLLVWQPVKGASAAAPPAPPVPVVSPSPIQVPVPPPPMSMPVQPPPAAPVAPAPLTSSRSPAPTPSPLPPLGSTGIRPTSRIRRTDGPALGSLFTSNPAPPPPDPEMDPPVSADTITASDPTTPIPPPAAPSPAPPSPPVGDGTPKKRVASTKLPSFFGQPPPPKKPGT